MGKHAGLGRGWLVLTFSALAAACGPRTPPEDASSATAVATTKPNDATNDTRWEGASKEDLQARQAGPPAGTAPAAVATGESRRTDQYDKDATEVVLKRAARQVKANCGHATDDSGKATGPWGKVNISVNLGHNGHSKGATIPPPFDGKPTGNCAIKAFGNLTFPPWAGSDTAVDWEVEIPQPGSEGK